MILLRVRVPHLAWEGDCEAAQQQAAFADWLCQLGDGRVELMPT